MKIKRKGAYCWKTIHHVDDVKDIELNWWQNQSAPIVAMAAEANMLHGKDVSEFICSHENKYDFLLRTKVPRNSRLVMVKDGEDLSLQNICRYYPSKSGGKLVKIMPPLKGKEDERRLSIDKDYNVKACNNIDDFKWDVDFSYYINEANKLIL